MGSTTSGPHGPAITPQDRVADLPTTVISLRAWHPNPIRGWPTLPRHPIAQTIRRGTGILTCCPSPTTLVLGLGPTNPTRIDLASETLGLRRTRISRVLRYSCRHSHFRSLQQSSQSAFTASGTLPYCPPCGRPTASAPGFSPVTFSAQDHLTSELLRTL